MIDCPFPARFDEEKREWLLDEGPVSWDEVLARWRKLDRRFAGHEAPRFRGTPPAFAGGSRWFRPGGTGWAGAPARFDDAAGPGDRTGAAVDSAVGVARRP